MYPYENGKIIVGVKKGFKDMDSLLQDIDIEKSEIIFHSKDDSGDIVLLTLKDKNPIVLQETMRQLSMNDSVNYTEVDYIEEEHMTSNDPLYNQLWGTQRVLAPFAWDFTTGNKSVVVGVIDTGIDYTHPDIYQNMWESPDGFIKNGWNFADNTQDSRDSDGHGTHVAGTIGAVGNNYIGITGICWNVQVVSMKFGLDVASAIAAIDFANAYHIPILNASWGGRAYSYALKEAIEHYDGLFIASSGNDGTNNDEYPIYPASYDCNNVISVAASDPMDYLARFSNYGKNSVDIVAPGTGILSLGLNGEYSPLNGTSMAAPHVAGAAALLKSYIPDLTTMELKNIILSSVQKIPFFDGFIKTSGLLDVYAMFEIAYHWLEISQFYDDK